MSADDRLHALASEEGMTNRLRELASKPRLTREFWEFVDTSLKLYVKGLIDEGDYVRLRKDIGDVALAEVQMRLRAYQRQLVRTPEATEEESPLFWCAKCNQAFWSSEETDSHTREGHKVIAWPFPLEINSEEAEATGESRLREVESLIAKWRDRSGPRLRSDDPRENAAGDIWIYAANELERALKGPARTPENGQS